ncbi:beta-alanine synthase [Eremomyces bilateralis CBS 781.70]|uniref:Beta-alanine synthase n=1 Tax=Eremomyces bilateralis CBS 781.70 TaxID=1392243 RepID=A0A6G1FSX2_9PEZI|nr:beta-alanine synthase [Eremomyces bilateralis CBS 781.70]KAF1808782.1 beta-alanine synthase [Eremomyces bilateralis CBS 781.70]
MATSNCLYHSCRLFTSLRITRQRKDFFNISQTKYFSYSYSTMFRSSEMQDQDIALLQVNRKRLMDELHHTCQWGIGERWGDGSNETGMRRLSLTDDDKSVRDWFIKTTQGLGCTTTIDTMGNIFAVRPGIKKGAPTYAGSHLDTQPQGGRYDGILGVQAGIEMLKILNENRVETEYPVGVVNWTNEEGARFPLSVHASAVWADKLPLSQAHGLASIIPPNKPTPFIDELSRIGYHGPTPCSYTANPMAAHFELHIEQGPQLEATGRKVGIVTGAQAYRWYTVSVSGKSCHTGTTPFEHRADPLLIAAKCMVQAQASAHIKKGALASTGVVKVAPGSVNTVPDEVTFSLDLRAQSDGVLDDLEKELKTVFKQLADGDDSCNTESFWAGNRKPCTVEWRTDSVSKAVNFNESCIECVAKSARSVLVLAGKDDTSAMRLVSGAGHDSVMTSHRVPTAMIFVPSREGISHNPREFTSEEDCAIGAEVLTQSVLRYDRLRVQ